MAGPLMMVEDSRSVLRGIGSYETLLTPQEQARATLLTGADRPDYVAAHVLVRICAARLADVPPQSIVIEQRCPGCGATDHGRPYVRDHPGLSVSLSHTRGTVAAAAGRSPVGIDVETTAGFVFDPRLAERVLGAEAAAAVRTAADPALAFLRRWVRKEALVKVGHGSLFGPATAESGTAESGADDARWQVRGWTARDSGAVAAAVSQEPLTLLRAGGRPYGPPNPDDRPGGP
ncbi:4'-phosphopantetheinyl transferase superfamily protein [Streptomyces sp. ISL-96]|uniref:4'-phosphopantetheinyl transferase family protein n=1 Tax=Streptomyces sp. ISL-96 TaxID=2819191 RepID=UPI001BE981C2|nr:4'-phosphopantetheinyl transferase superfamily protein [Streptomyces sp. ISL-96]MBT2488592.1 4'-phosphopantetheinyl transferase superfamily protein [Streptomyces sp. ISL-96]